jgi:hypothetical protein
MLLQKAERAAPRDAAGDPLIERLLENTQAEYKRLGAIIKNARRAGLIDWAAIEDRTRNVRTSASWGDPADIVAAAAQQYREDLWALRHYRPEVWIEKDALIEVIEAVCDEFRIPYFACRGNNSESEQYGAGKRFEAAIAAGLTPIVLHLGDHDPNGLDMTRDNRDRLALFARHPVEVRRLALNIDQVQQYHEQEGRLRQQAAQEAPVGHAGKGGRGPAYQPCGA